MFIFFFDKQSHVRVKKNQKTNRHINSTSPFVYVFIDTLHLLFIKSVQNYVSVAIFEAKKPICLVFIIFQRNNYISIGYVVLLSLL